MSPDRSELLVMSLTGSEAEGPLWIVPVLGGAARRLGDLLGHDATWSPDGERIVCANGSDLHLVRSDGSDAHKLATVSGVPADVSWSPDGRVLRFTQVDMRTFLTSLWEVSASGADLHPLLPGWSNPAAECCGRWTADGSYYFFTSTRGGTADVWALREKTDFLQRARRPPVQLTAGPLSFWAPSPGRDGHRLFVIGSQPRGELVRYDGASGQFTPYLGGISADCVDLSRDGGWVTYISVPGGSLWRARTDGSERLQLTFPPMFVYLPRWSPDGRRIVFMGKEPGQPWKNHLVSADGGRVERLLSGEDNEADPGWSPDGKSIVFGRPPPWWEGEGAAPRVIHVLDLETRAASVLPGSDGLYCPRWSPDGRYIAAMTQDSQRQMLFDVATREWRELAKIPGGYGSWSRDGRYVYFVSLVPGKGEAGVWRVRVSDRKAERVVGLESLRRATAWFGLALDDSPLVVRDVGTRDIYALEWQTP
jgi:Tol biopolymer transport system component